MQGGLRLIDLLGRTPQSPVITVRLEDFQTRKSGRKPLENRLEANAEKETPQWVPLLGTFNGEEPGRDFRPLIVKFRGAVEAAYLVESILDINFGDNVCEPSHYLFKSYALKKKKRRRSGTVL